MERRAFFRQTVTGSPALRRGRLPVGEGALAELFCRLRLTYLRRNIIIKAVRAAEDAAEQEQGI